jgi:murein tripeptide amidase MpaA
LGRQHPPETTGALALIGFVERLFETDALAKRFRDEVGILLYPLINPDGVDKGYWRHNVQGKDLNREWGLFSQPENRAIDTDVAQWLEKHDTQLIKAIDFHSTHYEVFYTQPDQSAETMPDLLGDWLADFEALMSARFDDFDIRRQVSKNPQGKCGKTLLLHALRYFLNDLGNG